VLLAAMCFWPQVVGAQDTALGAAQTSAGTAGAAEDNDDPDSPPTMFPHLETDRLWELRGGLSIRARECCGCSRS
jgi:hypothetical protein